MPRRWLVLGLLLAACAAPATTTASSPTTSPSTTTATSIPSTSVATTTAPPTTIATTTTAAAADPLAPPDWLGTRILPLRADGYGEVQPTPPELTDRRIRTTDVLPPPTGDSFAVTIEPVPAEVVARSTWTADCPVALDELRYLTVSHWGFDGEPHTGEIIVNAGHADAIAQVFETLFDSRFPIEEMRVIRADELDLPPTGDGNVTTSFVCRPAVGSTSWSAHASGLAIDINPFHNPYVRNDLVLPELASAYVDRDDLRPGMIHEGDPVVTAFDSIGWGWGGRWSSLLDWMHFSATGR